MAVAPSPAIRRAPGVSWTRRSSRSSLPLPNGIAINYAVRRGGPPSRIVHLARGSGDTSRTPLLPNDHHAEHRKRRLPPGTLRARPVPVTGQARRLQVQGRPGPPAVRGRGRIVAPSGALVLPRLRGAGRG